MWFNIQISNKILQHLTIQIHLWFRMFEIQVKFKTVWQGVLFAFLSYLIQYWVESLQNKILLADTIDLFGHIWQFQVPCVNIITIGEVILYVPRCLIDGRRLPSNYRFIVLVDSFSNCKTTFFIILMPDLMNLNLHQLMYSQLYSMLK